MAKTNAFDFTVDFDTGTLEHNLNGRFGIGSPVQARWDDIVKNGMRKYVPHDQGLLESSADINTILGSGEIIYRTPYARRLHYNPQYNFQGAPTRGGRWAERWADDNVKAAAAELQRFIDGV